MTADQLTVEKTARDNMTNEIAFIDNGAETGVIQPELYKQVMSALADFKKLGGDSTKDAAKAQSAHKVVNLAIQYLNVINDKKLKAIGEYVAAVDGVPVNSGAEADAGEGRSVNMRQRKKPPVVAAAM